MSRVYLPVRAQCAQCQRPSTRNPVSSNPATSLAAICRGMLQELAEPPGGAGGDARHRPRRQRNPEQLGQRLRGALLGQKLAGVQVDDDRGEPRPYCAGPSEPCGAAALVRCPQPHSRSISWCSVTVTVTVRQVEDLAALHPGHRAPCQPGPAPPAPARLMAHLPVRPGHLRQRAALMPVLPARLAAALLPQRPRPRRRLVQPLAGRRLRGIPRRLPQPRLQLTDPLPRLRQLRRAPAPAQPATQPAPRAARPPQPPAPHRGNRHHHQAQPDATTTPDRISRDPASSICLPAHGAGPSAVPYPAVLTGA